VQVEVIQRVMGFSPCPRFEPGLGMSDPGLRPQPGAIREPGRYRLLPAHRPSPGPPLSPDRASIRRRPPGSKLQLLGPVPLHDVRPTHLSVKPPRHRSLPPSPWLQALPPRKERTLNFTLAVSPLCRNEMAARHLQLMAASRDASWPSSCLDYGTMIEAVNHLGP
jgi:hypothetical protein